ncbi:hypothetical protein COCVIDRAFT_14159 [Bipolaris victoriae FI3]|uniref:Uncharacterized protein n=1 Tax=Bipolaris victoriae (strain FI3) TaxID=930091 RepID=W7EQC7_BIPV3|nr:hypothetical protein COCVIDRAFT_14159 [Bipolaris victoriae FI3]
MLMSRHNHRACRHGHMCRSIPFDPARRTPYPAPAPALAPALAPAPTHPATEWNYTPQDSEELFIKWGPYTIPHLIKASPHYTKITVDVDPYAKLQFPEKWESTERVIHAVHPIPRAELEDLGPNYVRQLGERLRGEVEEEMQSLRLRCRGR